MNTEAIYPLLFSQKKENEKGIEMSSPEIAF